MFHVVTLCPKWDFFCVVYIDIHYVFHVQSLVLQTETETDTMLVTSDNPKSSKQSYYANQTTYTSDTNMYRKQVQNMDVKS